MTPLVIVADTLIVLGFCLGVAALALISVPLALGVAGLVLFAAGIVLTALSARRPPRAPGVVDRGPFEGGT